MFRPEASLRNASSVSDAGPVLNAGPALQTWHGNKSQWLRATTVTLDASKEHTLDMWNAIDHLEQVAASHEAARLAAIAAKKAEAQRKRREWAAAAEKLKADRAEALLKQGSEETKKREAQAQAAAAAAAKAELLRHSEERRLAREAKVANRHRTEMQEASKTLGITKLNLQHNVSIRWGQLKRCEQRLEMRTGRPDHDKFNNDPVQDALETERQVLSASRQELQAIEQECEKAEDDLQAALARLAKLSGDREKKLISLETKQSPSTSLPSLGNDVGEPAHSTPQQIVSKSVSLPSIATASQTFSLSHSDSSALPRYLPPKKDKGLEGISVADLFKLSRERCDAALRLNQKGDRAIQRTTHECNGVTAKTQASLDKSRVGLEELKSSLERQRIEADRAINKAQKWIGRIRRLIGRNEQEPSPGDAAQLQAAEAALTQLKQSRARVENDFCCKVAALKIEESCRNLTVSRVDARGAVRKTRTVRNGSSSNNDVPTADEKDVPGVASGSDMARVAG